MPTTDRLLSPGFSGIAELLMVGLWGASAVEVFGFTWNSYKSTYTKFPGLTGGGATPPDVTKGFDSQFNQAKQGKPNDFTLNPFGIVGQVIGTTLHALGVGSGGPNSPSVNDKERARLQSLSAPPRHLVLAVKSANQSGDKTKLVNAANELSDWALKAGWKFPDVKAFLKIQGVAVF